MEAEVPLNGWQINFGQFSSPSYPHLYNADVPSLVKSFKEDGSYDEKICLGSSRGQAAPYVFKVLGDTMPAKDERQFGDQKDGRHKQGFHDETSMECVCSSWEDLGQTHKSHVPKGSSHTGCGTNFTNILLDMGDIKQSITLLHQGVCYQVGVCSLLRIKEGPWLHKILEFRVPTEVNIPQDLMFVQHLMMSDGKLGTQLKFNLFSLHILAQQFVILLFLMSKIES